MTHQRIEALPGKVILEFPPATEQVRGGIIIPERSRRRVEFARLVSIGDATTPEEEIRRRAIIEAANKGLLFPIAVASGIPFYQLELEQDTSKPTYGTEKDQDLGSFNFLKSMRAFSISQLYVTIEDAETVARFEAQS